MSKENLWSKLGSLESVSKLFKKVITKNFLPHDILYLRHRVLEGLGRKPIVVYTMGKVGSMTVFNAFQKQFFFPLTYHVHHLTDESFHYIAEQYKENDLNIAGNINLFNVLKGSSSHMSASQILRKPQAANSKRKWNIISLVRDPFSTYLSHLFQNPQIRRPFLLGEDGFLDKKKVEDYIEDIFLNLKPEKDYISNWFDREFFKFTGVDLYQYPFDAERGFSIIRENKFNIAVISLESLDSNLPLVIKEFTNSNKKISFKNKNVRTKNDKTGFYKDLKNEILVSREGLEKFYSTKYAKHFFTDEFRQHMINKWAKS